MNERQRELARHALGFPNKKNLSYRNHFCIGVGGDGYTDWESLVSQGLAVKRTSKLYGGDDMFHLTLKGALMARDTKEHLSREDAEMMRNLESTEPAADSTPHGGRPENPETKTSVPSRQPKKENQ
jgi:hypothetical protein